MATPVPYSPVPQVSPALEPTPAVHENTPLAAFGGAVAQATQHLGGVTEQGGQELFQRAYAIQTVNQEADASKAIGDLMGQLGAQYAQYSTLQGKNAVDGYQNYIDGIYKTRDQLRDSLNSPAAQRSFDMQSRYIVGRGIWGGSAHAAQQGKQYAIDANKAKISAAENLVYEAADSDDMSEQAMNDAKSSIYYGASIEGKPPETADMDWATQQSKMIAKRITGLARTDAPRAQKLLDESSGKLLPQDVPATTQFVKGQLYNTASRMEASKIMSGQDLSFGAVKVPLSEAEAAIGGHESSQNYGAIGPTVTTKGAADHALGRYQILASNLAPWLKEAGMGPMSEKEFLADPKAQDQLFDFKFGQYMNQSGSFNGAAVLWRGLGDKDQGTGENRAAYLQAVNANLAHNKPLSALVDAGNARANAIDPSDSQLADHITAGIETLYGRQQRIQKDDEFNHHQTIAAAAYDEGQSGHPPYSIEELTQDPQVKAAYDASLPSEQLKWQKVVQANQKRVLGDQLVYHGFTGMAQNQPDEFLSEDTLNKIMSSDDLSAAQKSSLMTLRDKVNKQAGADPNVSHALQVLGPTLRDANITALNNPNDYNQFTGTLQSVLQRFITDNKRPPKDEDIQAIGSRLLQEQYTPSRFLGLIPRQSDQGPLFKIAVPDDEAAAIRQQYIAKVGAAPTPIQLEAIYATKQYQKLYGKAPKAQ